jgi:hypothetical protein
MPAASSLRQKTLRNRTNSTQTGCFEAQVGVTLPLCHHGYPTQFLARDEARSLQKKLDRQIADKPMPKLVLYYESGNRDYFKAANAIAASIGDFTNVTLLYLFCVTGDGWSEGNASDERWRRYRLWRAANGDQRRLYDAPGHRFERGEGDDLSKVLALPFTLVGTLCSPQHLGANSCFSRTTTGWKSTVALIGVGLPRS